MKKILVAEDEETLRMLLVDTLLDEGYLIEEACDGEEALQFIQKGSYDLIILDYMMPVMTGLEVVEKIRLLRDEKKRKTKVMMLSAKSQQVDQQRAKSAGADYYVSKPFSPIDLVVLIGEITGE